MKTIIQYDGDFWGIALEFKIQDFWVGLFWKNRKLDIDIWLCLFFCLPIHYWSGREFK